MTMELQDLKKKTDDELRTLLAESQEKLRTLRFEVTNLQLKQVRNIRALRKTIAHIQTILNERNRQSQQTQLA